MRQMITLAIFLCLPRFSEAAAPAAPAPAAVDWTLDNSHSSIGFVVKHLAVSNVRGEFKEFSVQKLKADPASGKITALEASAATKSIDTRQEKRDNHLRSDDFFNAEKFPNLTLKLKSVTWNGDKFTADVDLTIRDKTKTVKLTGEKSSATRVNFGDGPQLRVGYQASTTINRKEFGLAWAKVIEAVPVVADDVKIELEIEMFRKGVES